MKRILLFVCLSAFAFCACDKAADAPSNNQSNGKKLEGKWTPVKMTISLKFDDGSVVNNTVPIKAGDYMEFTYLKTEGNNAKGTYKTRGVGFDSNGTWLLENQNNELTYQTIATDGQTVVLYRKVETVTGNKLLLTADDRLVKLWAEVNNLNVGEQKKVIGGSAYEEYSK